MCLDMIESRRDFEEVNEKNVPSICTTIPIICFSSIRLEKIPVRLSVGIMLFMASFVSYMLRVNFSIIIIAMTSSNATEKFIGNLTEIGSDAVFDDQFNWSKKDQGMLLAAYFYGYIFPNLLGGVLSEKFGGRIVIFIGLFLSAIITGLTPFAANDNFVFTFMVRLALGVLGVSLDQEIILTH